MAGVTRVRRAAFRLAAAVAGVAVLGSGLTAYLATDGGEQEVVSEVETVAPSPSAVPITTCAPVKPVNCNPDEGLSDAERHVLYERLRSEGDRQYREWLANLDVGALDLRSLPRGELPASYMPGESSLSEAVAKADLIVGGTISDFRPTPFSGIDTVINVQRTIKGSVGSTIVITQSGRLQPTADRSGIEIGEAANGRMLLPGDRAVLFLQKTEPAGEASGGYYIQSFSGWYQAVGGKVQSNPFNTFGASVEGKTEAEFVDLLIAAMQ